jgi:hypothetical protein
LVARGWGYPGVFLENAEIAGLRGKRVKINLRDAEKEGVIEARKESVAWSGGLRRRLIRIAI